MTIVNLVANLLSTYFERGCATHSLFLTSYVVKCENVSLDVDEIFCEKKRNDMIYLLTASGLSRGGSCTIHIYTQTIHRTTHDTKQTIHRTTQNLRTIQKFWNSAGPAPTWRVIPWHSPYNWGKSTEKPQLSHWMIYSHFYAVGMFICPYCLILWWVIKTKKDAQNWLILCFGRIRSSERKDNIFSV